MLSPEEFDALLAEHASTRIFPIAFKQIGKVEKDLTLIMEVGAAKKQLKIKASTFSRFTQLCGEHTVVPCFPNLSDQTVSSTTAQEAQFFFNMAMRFVCSDDTCVRTHLRTLLTQGDAAEPQFTKEWVAMNARSVQAASKVTTVRGMMSGKSSLMRLIGKQEEPDQRFAEQDNQMYQLHGILVMLQQHEILAGNRMKQLQSQLEDIKRYQSVEAQLLRNGISPQNPMLPPFFAAGFGWKCQIPEFEREIYYIQKFIIPMINISKQLNQQVQQALTKWTSTIMDHFAAMSNLEAATKRLQGAQNEPEKVRKLSELMERAAKATEDAKTIAEGQQFNYERLYNKYQDYMKSEFASCISHLMNTESYLGEAQKASCAKARDAIENGSVQISVTGQEIRIEMK